MPPPEDLPSADQPPRGGRFARDAWEAVVREELMRQRRRRPARAVREPDVEQVLPALRSIRPDQPPQEPL
jgi:hypothetical protein